MPLRRQARSTCYCHTHHPASPPKRSFSHQPLHCPAASHLGGETLARVRFHGFGSGPGWLARIPQETPPTEAHSEGGWLTRSSILCSWHLGNFIFSSEFLGWFRVLPHYNFCPYSKDSVFAWDAKLARMTGPRAWGHTALGGCAGCACVCTCACVLRAHVRTPRIPQALSALPAPPPAATQAFLPPRLLSLTTF